MHRCTTIYTFLILILLSFFSLAANAADAPQELIGFKIKECQFRLFGEDEKVWLDYTNSKVSPKVHFARFQEDLAKVEIGLNCPHQIKSKEVSLKHSLFSLARVSSDGEDFRVDIFTSAEGPVALTVKKPKGADSLRRVLLAPKPPAKEKSAKEDVDEFLQSEGEVLLPRPELIDRLVDKQYGAAKVKPDTKEQDSSGKKSSSEKPVSEVSVSEEAVANKPATKNPPSGTSIAGSTTTSAARNAGARRLNPDEPAPSVGTEVKTEVRSGSATEEYQAWKREHGRPEHGRPEHGRPEHGGLEQGRPASVLPLEAAPYQPEFTDLRSGLLFSFFLILSVLILFVWSRRNTARQHTQTAAALRSRDKALSDCYALLGVRASDSNDTIKKRYKHLVKIFHADKLSRQDLPEEMLALANERFQQIKDAYEQIREMRGL